MPSHVENDSHDESESQSGSWRRQLSILGGASLLLISCLVWSSRGSAPSNETLVGAEAAVATGDIRTAEQLSQEILRQYPLNSRARLVYAKCLQARNRPEEAIELLRDIAIAESPQSAEAARLAGDILFLTLYRPSEANDQYRQALKCDPASVEANDRLSVLLAVTGQWWEHIPVRLATLREGRFNAMDLLVLALADKALLNPELAEQMARVSPDDPFVLLANARLAIEDEQHDAAIRLLTRAVAQNNDLVQAQVMLGTAYFEQRDEIRFADWLRELPLSADEHPSIWTLRGKWALHREEPETALRCFCEAVQRDPNHSDAMYQAGRILESMDRSADAAPFFQRASRLQEFSNAVKTADSEDALAEIRRTAELAESLGNFWEAWAWATIAASHQSRPAWAYEIASRLTPLRSTLRLQRTLAKHNPVNSFDYKNLPLIETIDQTTETNATESPRISNEQFVFRDRAASAGIDFQYFNGSHDVAEGVRHMYEVMGGGVSVLDFNGDNRPDIFLTQGSRWPIKESNHEFLDRLYLHAGDGHFVDVTQNCGIVESGFSQGTTVGDFDSDGFPDLLVANIGRNRLFRNNGDGTFRDMSQEVRFNDDAWSTSCAIADMTGDGHPEIFVVNYLAGKDVFTRTCGPQLDRVCLPQHFPAATDQLLWNLGNEQFQDVTHSSGITVDNGKGLGIVVGSFGDGPGLDVFVGNDTVSNFYFKNQGNDSNNAPRFQETAMVSGLAVNGRGTAQACMGIAAGDADGDGATDLFVTNFHGESNTLYRQLGGGVFEDSTLRNRLRQPSLSKLGFGTQFLDADLDGRLDLVVANGHIDNNSDDGRTDYQMRPQFFVNQGSAGFLEVSPQTLGPYFENKVLGRALARADWNCDGQPDFVVTHLDAPVSLMENMTRPSGNFVVIDLHGVRSSRDAIGTMVQVETANRTLTQQLTAGDGFQASNQRVLMFGLGEDKAIRKLTVRWPSAQRNEYRELPVNTRLSIVEGRQTVFDVPHER
ncbi:FG-GAP-like repeat-containing protein [Fuerstiella marisgermanici]|uniref:Tetratricopeptide repeat protein n=1 Tax=Fuerstiella marisgermanici TaxID=1891926 RepID=A0A1P8WK27_9PLAN|nr:FG-GAP-like repeat-containing protein [Fuerstiella marisgermanici]APZ94414.1 tetratricopeptide repeat protein [Fuerstiella marisgermanici]